MLPIWEVPAIGGGEMLLEGSIRRFGLTGVLQFLAQNNATGVLEVHDFEEYGFIYLVDGRVEGISLPISDEKLGKRLLEVGCLDPQQLSEALMEDSALSHEEKRLKPLGQRLVEKGFTSEAEIREVMRWQTHDLVFELAHWRNGVFIYDEPEEMPHFEVAIQGDVHELLAQAQRRIEEGEQARKRDTSIEEGICYACPVAAECTPDIKARHLKSDVCLWRKMSAVADDDSLSRRDPRELYRSKENDEKSILDASIDWK
jgi:Domain of unknown function (DUF4388)